MTMDKAKGMAMDTETDTNMATAMDMTKVTGMAKAMPLWLGLQLWQRLFHYGYGYKSKMMVQWV
jgi:hypothetical protein